MCIYREEGSLKMGDLKKNWEKYHQVEMSPEDMDVVENQLTDFEEKTIERLRAYMKIFYKMQKEKETTEKKEDD